MSDQLQDYRRIVLECDFVNTWVPPIIASTGDLNGRMIVAKVTNNGSVVAPSEKLHAQLLVNPKPNDEGYFGDYVRMEPVSGYETAAFSCAIPYGAVSKPGMTRMGVAFLADNDDGTQDIICTRPFNVEVEQGVLRVDSDSAIGDFEENVRKAEQAAANAAESAEDAAGSASAAAESASSAAQSAQSASTSAGQAATSASNASRSETAAAGSAAAADSSADAAANSATAAKQSQDAAAKSASNAAESAETASNAATEARNAVDGFGLTVGDTTASAPGGNAVVTIEKTGTKYVANFTIPRGEQGPQGPQGAGLAAVAHDDTLTGDGTTGTPLGVSDTVARKTDIPSDYVSGSELADQLGNYVTTKNLSSTLNSYATDTELSQGLQAESSEREKQDSLLEESINGKIAASNVKAGAGIATRVSGSDVTVSLSPSVVQVTFEHTMFNSGQLTAVKTVTGLGSVNVVSYHATASNMEACRDSGAWLADHSDDNSIPAGQVRCTVDSAPDADLIFDILVMKA